jgi:hypothetical protein
MDFIERLFGISPDNGTGLSEIVIAACFFSIVVYVFRTKYSNQKISK